MEKLMAKSKALKGQYDERTVQVAYNPMRDRYFLTISDDGHNISATIVTSTIHQDQCQPIAEVFEQQGYKRLRDIV